MRALLLNSSVILVIKRFGGKFGGLGLANFYPEVALVQELK
jgi:hypothetical protein